VEFQQLYAAQRRVSAARGFASVGCKRLLSDELVILGMASNPEPRDSVFHVSANSTPVKADARGPELTDVLEMYGGVARI
jgi:hypothetical protein